MSRDRYTFDEVRAALDKEWGFSLQRGDKKGDGKHDGRWDTCYSKTGYVVAGNFPGYGYRHKRFRSLVGVVRATRLHEALARDRVRRGPS